MKKLGLLFSALFAWTCSLQAQVTLDITLAQDQFLTAEAMPVTVRVVNRSGQTLRFGNDSDWLVFSVESKDGYIVSKKGDVPVDDVDFTLESSKEGSFKVDIAPYFGFSKPGRYVVTASLIVREWNHQVSSAPKMFDIILGSKMWELDFGLPKSPGATNETPEIRRYALHQANYHRTRLMLYVQISDANGKVYRVFPIGPLLSFGKPEPQLDRLSNLHVLYQDGPRTYSYTVVDPHGTVLARHTYEMAPRPFLKVNAEGNFEVAGGLRRVKSTDVPPPTLSETNAVPQKP